VFNPFIIGTNSDATGFRLSHATGLQFSTRTRRSADTLINSTIIAPVSSQILRIDEANRVNLRTWYNSNLIINGSDNNSNFSMPINYVIGNSANSAQRQDISVSEIILYNTQQSANRVSLQNNINSFYNIY
jgi:hypothetical protein